MNLLSTLLVVSLFSAAASGQGTPEPAKPATPQAADQRKADTAKGKVVAPQAGEQAKAAVMHPRAMAFAP